MLDLTMVQRLAILAIPVLFAITLHEVAHGWVARLRGDSTAWMLGRLSLNPLRHIDPVGTILVPALTFVLGGILFGWAKPVPVNVRNFRQPRSDMALVAVAGPMANFAMALFWALVIRLSLTLGDSSSSVVWFLLLAGIAGMLINSVIMVLNLLPLPPLDGGRILAGLVPPRQSIMLDRIEPYGIWILVALLFTGILQTVLWHLINAINVILLPVSGLSAVQYQGLLLALLGN